MRKNNMINWREMEDNHKIIMAGGNCQWCGRDGCDHDDECGYLLAVEEDGSTRAKEICEEEDMLWTKYHEEWQKKNMK